MAGRDLQRVSCEVHVVEGDEAILTNSSRLLDIDDFIENLWKVHVQVKSEGYVQASLDDRCTRRTTSNSFNTAHSTRPVQVRLYGPCGPDRRLTTMREASRIQHNRLFVRRTFQPGFRFAPPLAIHRRLPRRSEQDHQRRITPGKHFSPEARTRPCKSTRGIHLFLLSRPPHMRTVHRPRPRTQRIRPASPRIQTQRYSLCANLPPLLQPRAGRHPPRAQHPQTPLHTNHTKSAPSTSAPATLPPTTPPKTTGPPACTSSAAPRSNALAS
jgi:hypothetical protein